MEKNTKVIFVFDEAALPAVRALQKALEEGTDFVHPESGKVFPIENIRRHGLRAIEDVRDLNEKESRKTQETG